MVSADRKAYWYATVPTLLLGCRLSSLSSGLTFFVFCIPGKKLPEYPAQEEEVLLLLESVTEAKRLSQMVIQVPFSFIYIFLCYLIWL